MSIRIFLLAFVVWLVACQKEEAAPPAASPPPEVPEAQASLDEVPAEEAKEADAPDTTSDTDLVAAKTELEEQRLVLAKERAALDAAKKEFAKQLSTLDQLERRLDERLKAGEVATRRRTERIGALADLLMSMAPQSAADMLAEMPDTDARALLAAMSVRDRRKTSKLLSAMPGDRAAALGQLYIEHDPEALKPSAKKPDDNESEAKTTESEAGA